MAPTKYAISSAGSVNPTLLSTEVRWAAMQCEPSCSSRTHSPACDSLYSLSLVLKCFLDLGVAKRNCSVIVKLFKPPDPWWPKFVRQQKFVRSIGPELRTQERAWNHACGR